MPSSSLARFHSRSGKAKVARLKPRPTATFFASASNVGRPFRGATLAVVLALISLVPVVWATEPPFADLQRTWKETDISPEEKNAIEARALAVPVSLVELCYRHILAVNEFMPDCNPNITSDAKVGIHQLAGAARAAYQTVLVVNSPPAQEKDRLRSLLREIRKIEEDLMD